MKNVKVGDQVVVNDLPDTQVYRVKEVRGHMVGLTYTVQGEDAETGWVDVTMIRKPTKKQLANHRA